MKVAIHSTSPPKGGAIAWPNVSGVLRERSLRARRQAGLILNCRPAFSEKWRVMQEQYSSEVPKAEEGMISVAWAAL